MDCYRLLNEDEVIQQGDESYKPYDMTWVDVSPYSVGRFVREYGNLFRRKFEMEVSIPDRREGDPGYSTMHKVTEGENIQDRMEVDNTEMITRYKILNNDTDSPIVLFIGDESDDKCNIVHKCNIVPATYVCKKCEKKWTVANRFIKYELVCGNCGNGVLSCGD